MAGWTGKVRKLLKNEDVLGWVIWGVLTLALLWPCIYFVYEYTYSTVSPATRVVSGVFVAAIAGGFLSWIVNEIMYRVKRRRKEGGKKAAKNRRKPGAR
ncbi:MAG: hypothetical protein GX580_14560 [Candidatus Hydrogenedens sp.]|nr:hypothetical protein [Candidatus Hydrogenedentota bacterium]NLF58849.1 hypothetical protein [Candidatus Hydrogenedens sp.]